MSDDAATKLAEAWITDLSRTGGVRVRFEDDADRDRYQAAARVAGRMLGRPMVTQVIRDQVHIMISDWAERPLVLHS